MTTRVLASAAVLMACSGGAARPSPLLDGLETAPDGAREWCRVAAKRCSQCHTVDRLLLARIKSPAHWRRYVARMRRKRASGISAADEPRIVRCLVYRSFGQTGLRTLESTELPR